MQFGEKQFTIKKTSNNRFNLTRLLSRFLLSLRSAESAPIDGSQVKRMLAGRFAPGGKMKTTINSSIFDNYRRIIAINSLIEAEYELTKGKDIRQQTIKNIDISGMYEDDVYYMHEESILIGLIISWSVTTLEGLVNHAIAETINNKIVSILAIENPRKLFEGMSKLSTISSELSYKIVLLDENSQESIDIAEIADRIVKIRNQIIHDKPYIIDYSDLENVKTEFYSLRKHEFQNIYVEDLIKIYSDMDKIKNFILKKTRKTSHLHKEKFDFISLISWI